MPLQGKNIAIIIANEFDEQEFRQPYERLREAGANVVVVGVEANQTLIGHHRQDEVSTDASFDNVSPDDFDAVVIPGGYSPDKLRLSQKAISFVHGIYQQGKLVAAICHAPSLLISAEVVRGKTLTSWPSITIDLKNAGAVVVDREIVIDGNIVTSRSVTDLPAFIQTIINILEGKAKMVAAS
ncbi:MAG TPA: type 1 glutamine amidotransferase domain-containing protein [Anaerolineae bacterium]|jgi:protease I|nr:type 1 glutamine amidotransferase domain-containing protein [Anaerolineae bacterium]